jgi:hypothetical protein
MTSLTAKAFRQQVLKPAEGVFLFHPRAMERLIEEQLADRLQGVSIPDLPYYLMPRGDFLYGLETENPEALSVIEGLRLPSYIILLPSPPAQDLEPAAFDRLRHDYWARSFEAEVARAWQMARDDNQDSAQQGAAALKGLIGRHAFAEIRDVLDRDGMILPVWDDGPVVRAFVALIARLRWFAPGARGLFFPGIRNWTRVDAWMLAGGVDLPPPLVDGRLPMLLNRSRPDGAASHPGMGPLLPTALPYGRSDPDRVRALVAQRARHQSPVTPRNAADAHESPSERIDPRLQSRCIDALHQGTRLRRRRGWIAEAGNWVADLLSRLSGRVLFSPLLEPLLSRRARTGGGLWIGAGLGLFSHAIRASQRADLEGRFATALLHQANARRLARRINRRCPEAMRRIADSIAVREIAAEESLAQELAAKWKLDSAGAEELGALVHRLAVEDRGDTISPPARALLGHLQALLRENRSDQFRLRPVHWLIHLGRTRIRQILPFQWLLRSLRSLEAARNRLDELPWSLEDLQRFSELLDMLTAQVAARLDAQLTPRLEWAMREADFIPRNHRENVAAHKMRAELLDVIKRRRGLKFTDVRDIVARNILRLPDPTLSELIRGDRLGRFDRAAARALPGVYRPGELYIKGLQQLGAPLFGTGTGRAITRHLLLPFGVAWLLLKSIDLLLGYVPWLTDGLQLTSALSVTLIGTAVNIGIYTGIGRHLAVELWHGGWAVLRFILYDGARRLLRWGPIAALLGTTLVRGLGRNLVEPLLIGILPLAPIIALAVLVEEVPIEPGLWLLGLAFALGTLARNTPAGRRFLDNLATGTGRILRRLNQALLVGLIQQLLYWFKEISRRFSQALSRVDEALTHHLGEHWLSLGLKALLTPLWRLSEAVMQFYITVLVEPQVNPIKHFPIVTIGHKIMLPFLPAITGALVAVTDSFLPKLIAFPLVTITIMLLPGLFGFLVWELKENWKLYQANHSRALAGADDIDGSETARVAATAIEPAIVGDHGETLRGLLTRGFHGGALPKAFDRLRRVIRAELRDQAAYSKRLRTGQRRLQELEHTLAVFVERELAFPLRERTLDPTCTLHRIATGTPRLATNLVALTVDIYPDPARDAATGAPDAAQPLTLQLCIWRQTTRLGLEIGVSGRLDRLGRRCWQMIGEDLRVFVQRAGADPTLDGGDALAALPA